MNRSEVNPTSVKLIFWLSLCDFVSACFMLGSYVTLLNKAQTHGVCCIHILVACEKPKIHFLIYMSLRLPQVMFRVVIQFGVLSAFLWTSVIAWVIRKEQSPGDSDDTAEEGFFQRVSDNCLDDSEIGTENYCISYHSLGDSLCYHLIHAASSRYNRCGPHWMVYISFSDFHLFRCALTPDFEIAFWVVPLVLSLLWNLVIYLTIARQLRASLGNFPSERAIILQMWARFRYTNDKGSQSSVSTFSPLWCVGYGIL